MLAGEGDDAAELGIELLDALEINVGETRGGEMALLNPTGKLGNRGIGDVGIVCRKCSGHVTAADEAIPGRAGMRAGQEGYIARERYGAGLLRDMSRAGAKFVECGHVGAPGGGRESPV